MTQQRAVTRPAQVRTAGWAGVAVLPMLILPLAVTAPDFPHLMPVWDMSPEDLAQWFTERRLAMVTQSMTALLGDVAFIWLFVGVAAVLAQARPPGMDVKLIVPMVVACSAMLQVSNVPWLLVALSGTTGHPASAELVHYGYELGAALALPAMFYGGLAAAAVGHAILRTRTMPSWQGWCGYAVGLLAALTGFGVLVGEGWLAPASLSVVVPYGLFFAWAFAVGVTLLRLPAGEGDQ